MRSNQTIGRIARFLPLFFCLLLWSTAPAAMTSIVNLEVDPETVESGEAVGLTVSTRGPFSSSPDRFRGSVQVDVFNIQ